MRILVLAHRWIPEHSAGAEVMLHGMLRALVVRGHEVVVLLWRQQGEQYKLDGLTIVPGADDPCVRGWIADPDTDVVVTHLEDTPRATLLAKWSSKPVIQVLHNTMDITREWLVREPVALAVHNSEWMLNDYRAWCLVNGRTLPRSIVVRPPVYAADYATKPGDRVTLINLRRMEESPGGGIMGKGAELFWELVERMPDIKFLGVKGAYGGQLVRDDLPNAEVLEHVPHDQMREQVYARTRVLLMPSSYESWGRTAIEAMASGIPVIAHPTPGLLEALGPDGLFRHRDDIDLWQRTLRYLAFSYDTHSADALRRSAELDPTDDLRAWSEAVESL